MKKISLKKILYVIYYLVVGGFIFLNITIFKLSGQNLINFVWIFLIIALIFKIIIYFNEKKGSNYFRKKRIK